VQSVILQLPTGAGKTHCAIAIIKHGLEHGRRINFCADRLTLIDQTFEKFMEHGIRCGVVQADHPARDPARPVQIISLQTLKRRRQWPDADLWIVDEAHDQHQVTYEAMVRGAKFIGLTATPFTTGLGLHWNRLVVGVTTAELIEAGYLSPYKAYGPSAPDMKGVGTTAGDYTKSEMEPRVREIIGSVVNHYMEHGEGRKALCFAVNVAHAKDLAGQFQAAGLEADYVEGRDTPDRRHEVLGKFRRGDLDVVVNCEVLTKGFDLPDIGCLILARPTRSLSLHIQMIGRGLRAAPGKDYCLILDHAGNIERLGFPDDDLPRELCMKEKGVSSADKREKKDPMPWNCPDCTHLNPETW
jgi:superfamily II DNA or RNA helicase